MKNIFRIYKNDIKKITHNWVALLVVGGVLILPSLYAWFNIAANMDPYSNTKDVRIAVANCDEGAENEMTGQLNAGNSIVENLKKNHQLGWQIVSKKQAMEGVRSGEYYAALIIPKNFSKGLISVLSGKIESPSIEYYVNEKKNAIAPKVTDTGATTIQEQVNATFVDVASESVIKLMKDTGLSAQGSLNGRIDEISSDLQSVESALQEQENQLNEMVNGQEGTSRKIEKSRELLSQVQKSGQQGSKTIEDCQQSLSKMRNGVEDFSTNLLSSVANAQILMANLNMAASTDLSNLNADMLTIQGKVDGITGAGNLVAAANAAELKRLEEINQDLVEWEKEQGIYDEKYDLSSKIEELKTKNQNYAVLLDEMDGIASDFVNLSGNLVQYQNTLTNDMQNAQKGLSSAQSSFAANVLPGLNGSLDQLTEHMSDLSAALDRIDPLCTELDNLLTQLDLTMGQTYKALQSTSDMLSGVNESIRSTEEDLNALRSAVNYGTYADLLTGQGIDSNKVADFVSAPVELKTETLYSVDNYGSGMTPFYTNLAIWVSGIVLVSLFKMEIDKEDRKRLSKEKRLTATESYFGRWLLFITVGLLQALIICAGNLLLLHVQCESLLRYFWAGCVISFVYINLIYALAITLKHIGKALCVLLVILQIPASAGTFPIELTPVFFQRLHMFLPFTYGINAMREAMFGCYHHLYSSNLWKLQIFLAVALVIGLGVRALILNMNRMIDIRLEKTGLFLCEESGMTRKTISLTAALTILSSDESIRAQIRRKAKHFEISYRRMTRIGFFLVLMLPLTFLVTMFVVDKSAKMLFLILWIVSLVAICFFLIVLEYFHERVRSNLEYINRSEEELTEAMKEELRS